MAKKLFEVLVWPRLLEVLKPPMAFICFHHLLAPCFFHVSFHLTEVYHYLPYSWSQGGFKILYISPNPWGPQFSEHLFQSRDENHQLDRYDP